MKPKTKALFIRVTEGDHDRLKREADALDMSVADLVRRGVRMILPSLKKRFADEEERAGG